MNQPNEGMRERFEKLKKTVFKDDLVTQVRTTEKVEYLHETLPELNLANGHYTPIDFIANEIEAGAIDSRMVSVTEKTWKQSELVYDFLNSEIDLALAKQREELIEVIKNSRTVDETYGIGKSEDQARMQAIIDIKVSTITKDTKD